MPASPIAAYRSAHRLAVGQETWKYSAARAIGHPSSTIRRASLRRALGVKAALAWDTRTSWWWRGTVDKSHSTPGGPPPSRRSATRAHHSPGSTNLPGQYS